MFCCVYCPHACFHSLFVHPMNANIFVSVTSEFNGFFLSIIISAQSPGQIKYEREKRTNNKKKILLRHKKAPTTYGAKKQKVKFHRKSISIYGLKAKNRANFRNHHVGYRTDCVLYLYTLFLTYQPVGC